MYQKLMQISAIGLLTVSCSFFVNDKGVRETANASGQGCGYLTARISAPGVLDARRQADFSLRTVELQARAENGDPVAKLLVKYGSPEERDRVEQLILLEKRTNPDVSDDVISRKVASEVQKCK